jgi:uncharacterized membrane protein
MRDVRKGMKLIIEGHAGGFYLVRRIAAEPAAAAHAIDNDGVAGQDRSRSLGRGGIRFLPKAPRHNRAVIAGTRTGRRAALAISGGITP